MTWQLEPFGRYFADILGGKPTSFAKYRSFLNRIDQLAGGLDELIEQRGLDGVRSWARNQTEPPFDKFVSDARSIVNSYLGFRREGFETIGTMSLEGPEVENPPIGAMFKIEKEMQAAVRRDLAALEAGLVAVDDGIEVATATGRVDILARDAGGILTVIELKAGVCPAGAIEQALGYAQALSEERGERVKAIVIASAFTERQRVACRRVPELALKQYSYQLTYVSV